MKNPERLGVVIRGFEAVSKPAATSLEYRIQANAVQILPLNPRKQPGSGNVQWHFLYGDSTPSPDDTRVPESETKRFLAESTSNRSLRQPQSPGARTNSRQVRAAR